MLPGQLSAQFGGVGLPLLDDDLPQIAVKAPQIATFAVASAPPVPEH